MKKLFFITVLLTFSFAFSQEDQENTEEMIVKRNRISVHLGTPGIYALNYEYVIPVLEDNIAPYVNLSYIPIGVDNIDYANSNKANFSFSSLMLGIGAKYYIMGKGQGFFGALEYNYQNFSLDIDGFNYFEDETIEFTNPISGEETVLGFKDGTIESSLPMHQFTPKVGYTYVGEDSGFTFGVEAGWNFAFLPDSFEADISAVATNDFNFNGEDVKKDEAFNTTLNMNFTNQYLNDFKLTGYLAFAMKFGFAF
jgi:hypothetical protein